MKNIGLKITEESIKEIEEFVGEYLDGPEWTQYMLELVFGLNEHLLEEQILFVFDFNRYLDVENGYDYIGDPYNYQYLEEEGKAIIDMVNLEEIAEYINNNQDRFKVRAEIFTMDLSPHSSELPS